MSEILSVKFENLKIENWRQFLSVDLEIHPKLTILTGANGAGKTTLVNVLSQHFGWSRPLLSTPWIDPDGKLSFVSGALSEFLSFFRKKEPTTIAIGSIRYSNRNTAKLVVPIAEQLQYHISIENQQQVMGISIPSHRFESKYQTVGTIPASAIDAAQAYGSYFSEMQTRANGGHSGFSPLFRMKEALISMAMFGEGNKYIKGRPPLLEIFVGFVEVLRQVLPPSLGFVDIEVQPTDVMLKTKSGTFLIDSVSGGIGSIIDLAWQLLNRPGI